MKEKYFYFRYANILGEGCEQKNNPKTSSRLCLVIGITGSDYFLCFPCETKKNNRKIHQFEVLIPSFKGGCKKNTVVQIDQFRVVHKNDFKEGQFPKSISLQQAKEIRSKLKDLLFRHTSQSFAKGKIYEVEEVWGVSQYLALADWQKISKDSSKKYYDQRTQFIKLDTINNNYIIRTFDKIRVKEKILKTNMKEVNNINAMLIRLMDNRILDL